MLAPPADRPNGWPGLASNHGQRTLDKWATSSVQLVNAFGQMPGKCSTGTRYNGAELSPLCENTGQAASAAPSYDIKIVDGGPKLPPTRPLRLPSSATLSKCPPDDRALGVDRSPQNTYFTTTPHALRHIYMFSASHPRGEQTETTNSINIIPLRVGRYIVVVAQDLISQTAPSRPGTPRVRCLVSRTGQPSRAPDETMSWSKLDKSTRASASLTSRSPGVREMTSGKVLYTTTFPCATAHTIAARQSRPQQVKPWEEDKTGSQTPGLLAASSATAAHEERWYMQPRISIAP
ncbi:hypothetical protein LZ32DRAFT_618775 [Colletotrichum eremochloae]|nr:hypothetical protein LZ32DRAFT_618775 [Colletotrichum eremochloae]